MTRARSGAGWDRRIERARELARDMPAARELLTFYVELATFQRSLFLEARHMTGDGVDLDSASAAVPRFLARLRQAAPPPLAQAAAALLAEAVDWPALMRQRLMLPAPALDDHRAFVVDALLQPCFEAAAVDRRAEGEGPASGSKTFTSRCPMCAALPCVGILCEEGQGAKRMLVCSRCLTEWEYLRVVCAGCGEERFDALPVYTADACPHARIEACDSCRRYLKTIDLTRNGLAVAVVDDLATTMLDLWASEQGYERLQGNILRTAEPETRQPRA